MLKGNYKAWIISITLHAMLLLLFVRYGKSVKLPAVAEPPKVINAYVSVDLTSLPSLQKTQDKPLLEQPQEIVDEAKALPQKRKPLIAALSRKAMLSSLNIQLVSPKK
ncbi:hypothetical protein [Pseudoalteromonas gelatinilytica]